MSIREVLEADLDRKASTQDIRALFAFDSTHTDAEVLQRFRLWSRHFFFNYFHMADAPFHAKMDARYVALYRGTRPVFISPRLRRHYPEIFEKTTEKREGMGQRGDIQEDSRPSLLWFEDFENRKVLTLGGHAPEHLGQHGRGPH